MSRLQRLGKASAGLHSVQGVTSRLESRHAPDDDGAPVDAHAVGVGDHAALSAMAAKCKQAPPNSRHAMSNLQGRERQSLGESG